MSALNDTMFSRPQVQATATDLARLRSLVQMAGTEAPGADLFKEEFARLKIVADELADGLMISEGVTSRSCQKPVVVLLWMATDEAV